MNPAVVTIRPSSFSLICAEKNCLAYTGVSIITNTSPFEKRVQLHVLPNRSISFCTSSVHRLLRSRTCDTGLDTAMVVDLLLSMMVPGDASRFSSSSHVGVNEGHIMSSGRSDRSRTMLVLPHGQTISSRWKKDRTQPMMLHTHSTDPKWRV